MAKLPGATQDARIVGERHERSQRRANPEGRMPLFDHLRELRNRVVKMALALAAGMQIASIQRRAAVSSSLVARLLYPSGG
jgi:Sec-independent protein secretion pathway component TatC